MSTPLVKYQAYELVHMEHRFIVNIPAPGTTVYLAVDVDARIAALQEAQLAWFESESALRLQRDGLRTINDTLLARVAALEGALKELKSEVADCVDELIEQVLYPMNEGDMNPVKMDVCLAQLTQAVDKIAAEALEASR